MPYTNIISTVTTVRYDFIKTMEKLLHNKSKNEKNNKNFMNSNNFSFFFC